MLGKQNRNDAFNRPHVQQLRHITFERHGSFRWVAIIDGVKTPLNWHTPERTLCYIAETFYADGLVGSIPDDFAVTLSALLIAKHPSSLAATVLWHRVLDLSSSVQTATASKKEEEHRKLGGQAQEIAFGLVMLANTADNGHQAPNRN